MVGSAPVDDVRERALRFREAQIEYRRSLDEVVRLKRHLARAERRVAAARVSLVGAQGNIESLAGVSAARSEINVTDDLPQNRPA